VEKYGLALRRIPVEELVEVRVERLLVRGNNL